MTRDVQKLSPGPVERHHHDDAYAAIVLNGGYRERGDQGVLSGRAGDFIVHLPFEQHGNAIGRGGADVFNVPLTIAEAVSLRSGRLDEPLAVIAELRRGMPIARVLPSLGPGIARDCEDEADALALRLRGHRDGGSLEAIAREIGASPRTLRRQFGRLYGMSAAQFRARARARRAWSAILTTGSALADIAADTGFADQAHMTRAVSALTGRPPSAWLRIGRLIQDVGRDHGQG